MKAVIFFKQHILREIVSPYFVPILIFLSLSVIHTLASALIKTPDYYDFRFQTDKNVAVEKMEDLINIREESLKHIRSLKFLSAQDIEKITIDQGKDINTIKTSLKSIKLMTDREYYYTYAASPSISYLSSVLGFGQYSKPMPEEEVLKIIEAGLKSESQYIKATATNINNRVVWISSNGANSLMLKVSTLLNSLLIPLFCVVLTISVLRRNKVSTYTPMKDFSLKFTSALITILIVLLIQKILTFGILNLLFDTKDSIMHVILPGAVIDDLKSSTKTIQFRHLILIIQSLDLLYPLFIAALTSLIYQLLRNIPAAAILTLTVILSPFKSMINPEDGFLRFILPLFHSQWLQTINSINMNSNLQKYYSGLNLRTFEAINIPLQAMAFYLITGLLTVSFLSFLILKLRTK